MSVADSEIEEDCCRDDRDNLIAKAEADAVLFQVPHGAGGRIETKGTSAREHDAMDLLDRIDRVQQIGLTRARRSATHVHAGDRAFTKEDRGASGGSARVSEVADFDARNAGEGTWLAVSAARGVAAMRDLVKDRRFTGSPG